MNSKWTYLFVSTLLGLCHSAFVNTLTKCSYKDNKCVSGAIMKLMKATSENGVPEYNIPPIDPIKLKNMNIPVPGLFNMTLVEGQTNGIKDCVISSTANDFETGITTMDVTCDLAFKGKFTVNDISPAVQKFVDQNATTANADVKIKVDKIHVKMYFHYEIIKKNKDVYFNCFVDKFKYEFELGNFEMKDSNIMFGNQDISEFVQRFFNQNWKTLTPTLIRGALDVLLNILNEFILNFFNNIPAQIYYSDDLSSFVKN